jgi:hypothetical protein
MGNNQSMQKINFEDVQYAIKNSKIYLIINTLSEGEQDCLILNTIHSSKEEQIMNHYIQHNKQIHIIVYGRNSNDEKIYKKYQQLLSLGFANVYIYMGGLFEWLMMQDIFGFEEFPSTINQLDFLKYKPRQRLNIGLLENNY